MALLKIARLGHPGLRARTRRITRAELSAPRTQKLIDDMFETMVNAEGVGLAAPQVHSDLRLLIVGPFGGTIESSEGVQEEIVLANAYLVARGQGKARAEIEEEWEGCLSIPDLRGLTPRRRFVCARGLDRTGRPVEILAQGFLARVLQHEIDHLDGKVYLDRMKNLGSLSYSREWEEVHLQEPQ